MEKVKNVMSTYVQDINESSTAVDAAKVMDDKELGFLIVRNSAGITKGVVSASDIIGKIVAAGKNPGDVKIAEIMTEKYLSVGPENTLHDVARILKQYKLRRLPVVEEDKVVGIISSTDLVKCIVKQRDESLFKLAEEF